MNIGLFFGSFNPIHIGHLIIANYVVSTAKLNSVWFVVSPQNPFKKKANLLNEYDRLHLVELAIQDNEYLQASPIEFSLPKPSYTIDTLTHLKFKKPNHEFTLIMGSDNLKHLHKWKNADRLIEQYPIIVYKRKDLIENPYSHVDSIKLLDVPLLDISATFIRASIKSGVSMRYFLPDEVHEYIDKMNWYR